jgi:subtilase family serine protease
VQPPRCPTAAGELITGGYQEEKVLTSQGGRRGLLTLAGAAAIAFASVSPVIPASATVRPWASNSDTSLAGSPSKQQQIKVLKAALRNMQKNFAKYRQITPGPQDIFDYQIGNLWERGIDGFGTTIAVMEGWDFPGIAKFIAGFDKKFLLPNPKIQTIFPNGPLPPKCPPGMVKLRGYGSCAAWQGELALDVLAAHLVAPYASIVISATPADSEITGDAASQVAMPEIMKGVEYISTHHLANVVSISDGTGETTYRSGAEEITAQDPGELSAAAAGIPVMVASGDCGVVQNLAVASGQCADVSATPDTAAWDDSPWVTAVGGSVPNLTPAGQKAGPDPLWHPAPAGEGAGYSSVFLRPSYQNEVAAITGSPMRSVPDITMDAQNGTSEAAPLLAGVLALATQLNKANIGPVNPALYKMGPAGAADGIADVVTGNNSSASVPGFAAAKGFDVASGWGTVNASRFVPSLVAVTRTEDEEAQARRQASAQLAQFAHGIVLSRTSAVDHSVYLLDQGFLPGYPVQLSIDGKQVAKLTASMLGYVTYMIDPATLKLAAGRHTVRLTSMLVTATATFSTGS